MRHVGFENHRAAARKRRRIGYVGAKLCGFLHIQGEALNQLAEEVAGALGTAAVFAERRSPIAAKFQHGKAVAANVYYGQWIVAAKKPASSQLSLFDGNSRELDLRRKAPRNGRSRCGGPIPLTQQIQQRSGGFLAVLEHLAPAHSASIFSAQYLDQLQCFRSRINADEAASCSRHHSTIRS